jgi:hypothetical protein
MRPNQWVIGVRTLKERLEVACQCSLFERTLTRSEIHLFKFGFKEIGTGVIMVVEMRRGIELKRRNDADQADARNYQGE